MLTLQNCHENWIFETLRTCAWTAVQISWDLKKATAGLPQPNVTRPVLDPALSAKYTV